MSKCLHGRCHRAGKTLPQGYGFTFCAWHAPAAKKVLRGSLPRTVDPTIVPDRTPDDWVCDHTPAGWNIRINYTRGVAYHRCRSCLIGYGRKYKHPKRWASADQAADAAYQELKEKHA